MDNSIKIDTFSRFTRVSRETINSLILYENLLLNANKKLNLIGKSTTNDIWIRHFLDSAQVIDLIEENDKSIVDVGSGAGLPGVVLAILLKNRKNSLKVTLIEKSPKKVAFLKEVNKKLQLDMNIINENIFDMENNLDYDLITSRAFKPIKIFLALIHKKTKKFKKIFFFLGKTGKSELLQASKNWNIEYKQRKSVTSDDSIIVEINKLEKK
tara:strand:+ start:93 stop:728 length:636 start_codon:yes stop_codon:yes gene_type:complete